MGLEPHILWSEGEEMFRLGDEPSSSLILWSAQRGLGLVGLGACVLYLLSVGFVILLIRQHLRVAVWAL